MQPKSTRGVQQVDVDFAADALLAEGARPTVERVRLKLGRGSPNTVGPLLEAWFGGLAARLGARSGSSGEEGEAPPAALRQALHDLWTQSLASARSEAAAGVAPVQAQLAQDRQALELARVELQRHEAALAQRASALDQTLEMARTQLKEQGAQLEDAGKQLAQARASLARLVEERDADRRRFDAQAEAAGQERERLQAREQATERRLLEEVDRARQDAKQARSETAEAARRHESALASLQQRLESALEVQAQDRVDKAALQERLAAAEQRGRELQQQLGAAQSAALSKPPRKKATAARKRAGV